MSARSRRDSSLPHPTALHKVHASVPSRADLDAFDHLMQPPDLVQCPDCDAAIRRDARYCSNCARNIVGERAFVRGLLAVVAVVVVLAALGIGYIFLPGR
jgi:hypothetical protein